MNNKFNKKPSEHLHKPANKKTLNKELFSEVAPKYDFITNILSFGRDDAWKKHFIKMLPDIAATVCVDLACGTGDITRLLCKRYPDGKITGLDLTPEMLDIAIAHKCSEENYIEGDMNNLPFSDESIDIVTGSYALRNAPDLDVALNEVARVLKYDGFAAFLDFSKPDNKIGQHIAFFMLKFWGFLWGILLHGNPHVYGYIADSLKLFPPRSEIRQRFKAHGFITVKSRKFFFGMIEMFLLQKKQESYSK